jgi:hypothetical protein
VGTCLRWVVLWAVISQCCFGAIWVETGSAGDLPATAQPTVGAGSLDSILGNLIAIDEVDMFSIRITSPLAFSARTIEQIGFNIPDPQLFLFSFAGRGVYMSDDGNGSQSVLPAAHPLGPSSAGFYYLAIGRFDNEPFSAGGRIFTNALAVNGPDPAAGGSLPITSWDRNVSGRIDFETFYEIQLTGAQFSNIPEPGSLLLFTAGLVLLVAQAFKPVSQVWPLTR